jgi:hypothetical protein
LRDQLGREARLEPDDISSLGEEGVGRKSGEAKYALLKAEPIAGETFLSDKGSPLMAHTIAKAAATGSGAAGSIRDLPGVVKPPVSVLRTLTLGGFRVVSTTRGIARWTIIAGALLLLVGVAFAIQSAALFGFGGLAMAGIGGYLIILGTWQTSNRLLFAILSATLVGAVLSLTLPVMRTRLFGTEGQPGWVGAHTYWLGAQWWHPLIVVAGMPLWSPRSASPGPTVNHETAKQCVRPATRERLSKRIHDNLHARPGRDRAPRLLCRVVGIQRLSTRRTSTDRK